jgi:hypothetical protein
LISFSRNNGGLAFSHAASRGFFPT